ncbi:hypothetical protein [Anaeromyxobacter sp. Fw109-5]|uniref:hypothetical protein n=1 Tax=Anaeromyxobacter sp. (strain Fw109-5) TaxID=404589 RepID=UPI0002EFF746|nr:hypothetical protein [Anaeromyxobacter sp. Fw109-5]
MIQIREPRLLAQIIELELVRFREAGRIIRVPPALEELAEALDRVAVILRQADDRGQSVDLADEVMRLIQQFRGALRTVGGAPAEA